ncbi:ATP-binding protein [Streptomyces dioscori]|uniref:ATP-binding protein n=2 Tax=Streptomyces dioscori TaxID=2109333 RepID=A0A2P8QCM2_9ACTN|nr:ATP-binding protein [Streptomyces dioscori]
MELSGDTSCIAAARRLAAEFLARAGTEQHVDVSDHALGLTQLVVSELVTNARRHAPGPALMELRIADSTVEVTVQDSVPVRPTIHASDPQRIGRHGLEIVAAVAADFYVRLEDTGKRVTANIALTDPSAPRPPEP